MENEIFKEKSSLLALAMIIMEEIFRRSYYCDFPLFESLCTIVMILSCGMEACKLGIDLYQRKITYDKLVIITVFFLYSIFLLFRGQTDAFLVLWLFSAALHDVDFNKIIKVSVFSMIVAILIVFAGGVMGSVENSSKTLVQVKEERNRNGLGFKEAYQAAYFMFFASLSWGYYRKKKLTWYEIITLGFVNYVVFQQSDTRGPYYLSVVLLLSVAVFKLIPALERYRKWYTIVAIVTPIICATLVIIQGYFINPNSSEFTRKLNALLSNRLILNYHGVHYYGFSFLGQPIEWYIGDGNVWNSYKNYNWVDSVYLYSTLSYGIPFMTGFFALTSRLAYLAERKKDTYMIIALVLIAILGLWDNYCFRIECNPFYLFFAYEASVNSSELSLGERKNEIFKKYT